jgi:hypothetical protein
MSSVTQVSVEAHGVQEYRVHVSYRIINILRSTKVDPQHMCKDASWLVSGFFLCEINYT